jgi:hypothetical protein
MNCPWMEGCLISPEKDGKQIIPIRNALAINKPVAFVITLEATRWCG